MKITYKDLQEMVIDIGEMYILLNSKSIATAAYDYLKDVGVFIGMGDFRLMCHMLAEAENVVVPTAADMRHFHGLLFEDVNVEQEAS